MEMEGLSSFARSTGRRLSKTFMFGAVSVDSKCQSRLFVGRKMSHHFIYGNTETRKKKKGTARQRQMLPSLPSTQDLIGSGCIAMH